MLGIQRVRYLAHNTESIWVFTVCKITSRVLPFDTSLFYYLYYDRLTWLPIFLETYQSLLKIEALTTIVTVFFLIKRC